MIGRLPSHSPRRAAASLLPAAVPVEMAPRPRKAMAEEGSSSSTMARAAAAGAAGRQRWCWAAAEGDAEEWDGKATIILACLLVAAASSLTRR